MTALSGYSHFIPNKQNRWAWLTILAILAFAIYQLYNQGRLWICECGQVYLWAGDIWSADNSQHLSLSRNFNFVQ